MAKQRKCSRISIHSPLTGRDAFFWHMSVLSWIISIHSPLTGRDLGEVEKRVREKIFQSTLPSRGETFALTTTRLVSCYFNPLSPHGERQSDALRGGNAEPFQSTLPSRGETRFVDKFMIFKRFQSTLPSRGETW